jgi:phage anti-repressor protein
MNILSQNFVQQAIVAERDGVKFPVDFDLVWQPIGYTRKDNAKRSLLASGYVEGEDFQVFLINEENSKGGRPEEKIFLTIDCFKAFCMMARSEAGREIRQYFIETEKAYRAQLERLLLATPREADNTRYTITCWKVHQDSGIKDPYYVRDVIVDNYDHKIVNQIVCVTRLTYEDLLENFRSQTGADISQLPVEKQRKFQKSKGKKNKREPQVLNDCVQLNLF